MIRDFDHYHPGQRKKRIRVILIPTLSVLVVVAVVLLVLLGIPARLFGTGGQRRAPGKLPDLFRAQKYDDVITAANAVLVGDPLNPVALSYKGFASFYKSTSQDAAEEKMPSLDQAP